MTAAAPATSLHLRSLITSDGTLELSLASLPIPQPAAHEVIVRVDAAPINPSDLGILFGFADMSTATAAGTADQPVITARVPAAAMRAMAGRAGTSMPVGNEGAGVVIAAGASDAAQALLGRTVAILGGGMYAQHRAVPAAQCLAMEEGTTAAEAASAFVNPMTALAMVETMRREGHTALVHTAAASSVGQMLNRLCLAEKIPLVNIVRRAEQAKLLRDLGAVHVLESTSPTFLADLTDALAATGATLAFDAIGGGKLAGQILSCMEAAINRSAKEYSLYGSATHKQVYIYGALDFSPTDLGRTYGMSWGIGGWLVFRYLQKCGPDTMNALKARVAKEIKTTFATRYTREITLAEVLHLDVIAAYGKRATDSKFLVTPNRG